MGYHRAGFDVVGAARAAEARYGRRLGRDAAELSEAIPPAYTEYIGAQLIRHVRRAALSDEGKP
jgi:hypothetical protein